MKRISVVSNYQEGSRNAKIYRMPKGEWGVIVFDAQDDYNGFASFVSEEQAEIFAEDWVTKNDNTI